MKQKDLPQSYKPSYKDSQQVLYYLKRQQKFVLHERSLNRLFLDLCPQNDKVEDIMIKCSTLNDFYSTNIFDVHAMAEHVLNLNIDKRLRDHDYSLVDDISNVVIDGKSHHFYSFATKYCSHHQPEKYAIYDSYVEKVLLSLKKKEDFADFRKEDLKDYETYMRVIHSFRQHFGLVKYSIKELDQYVWQLGKWYFNQYGLTYKYYNREEESPFAKEDIKDKFWYGEMMFVTTHQSVGKWKEDGKEWLKTANEQIKQLGSRYTPEQFGVISYISALFGKWCPYDDQLWILEY